MSINHLPWPGPRWTQRKADENTSAPKDFQLVERQTDIGRGMVSTDVHGLGPGPGHHVTPLHRLLLQ